TLVLSTIDRIKQILGDLERTQHEPAGDDRDLIAQLEHMAMQGMAEAKPPVTTGSLVYQVLERPLRPGEVSLDELERAFRETPGPQPAPAPPPAKPASLPPAPGRERRGEAGEAGGRADGKVASQSIRVNVETLEPLMTMVSELVLSRN